MASGWNGSGTVVLTDGVYNTDWCQSQAADGDSTIYAIELDALFQCIEDTLQACYPRNGEAALTANLAGGGYRLTNITASANNDAGTYGKQVASGAYSAVSDEITLTLNDSSTITIDTSALSAGTGGVALTGDQEISGAKSFDELKTDGMTKHDVLVPTPGSSVTVNAAGGDRHYLTVGVNTTIDFTWPTAASDSQLGDYWMISGSVLCRTTGSYSISLGSTTTSALDDYDLEGSAASGSGEISTLVYTYYYLNGTEYAHFAWVATP